MKDIIEVQEAKLYTVLADEVTSHNKEHLVLCIRVVDGRKKYYRSLLGFVSLTRITGEHLANNITPKKIGLPAEIIRGQGYDGASNMSSCRVGVD